jgi:catechol 2,3-dioxygenase-like lactoylglutathione lyase family enzyme
VLVALDHAIVAVHELDPAVRETAALLGRAPSWRGSHPNAGTANALFRLDNTYLELLAPAGPGPVGEGLRARLLAEGEGLAGLAFATPDARACAASLRERGLDAAEPRPGLGRDDESGAFRRWRTVELPLASTRGLLLFAIEHLSPADLLPRAPALGDERAAVGALDHAVVFSTDLDDARRLFGGALGLRLALDRSFAERGLHMLFFRVGGATLEVVGQLGEPAGADRSRDRFGGLAWRVQDAEAARARLAADGFDVSEVRPGHKRGTRVCTVRDRTHGVPTLLIGPDA